VNRPVHQESLAALRARETGSPACTRRRGPHLALWRALLICCLMAFQGAGWSQQPGETGALEYKVKAGFLFNFLKFVEWPAKAFQSPDAPFIIGVVDRENAASILEEVLRNKAVNGRPLIVKRLPAGEDLQTCHLLFIARSEKERVAQILASVKDAPVLTVGEVNEFARQGGKINFVMKDGYVRFEINLAAARQAGLKISSRLSSMAAIIKPQAATEAP
jgi:hypothetical protein